MAVAGVGATTITLTPICPQSRSLTVNTIYGSIRNRWHAAWMDNSVRRCIIYSHARMQSNITAHHAVHGYGDLHRICTPHHESAPPGLHAARTCRQYYRILPSIDQVDWHLALTITNIAYFRRHELQCCGDWRCNNILQIWWIGRVIFISAIS